MILFEFNFNKGCLSDYAINYFKDNKINYFYCLGCLCADVYEIGVFFKVNIENISGCRFSCGIDPDIYTTPNKTRFNYL